MVSSGGACLRHHEAGFAHLAAHGGGHDRRRRRVALAAAGQVCHRVAEAHLCVPIQALSTDFLHSLWSQIGLRWRRRARCAIGSPKRTCARTASQNRRSALNFTLATEPDRVALAAAGQVRRRVAEAHLSRRQPKEAPQHPRLSIQDIALQAVSQGHGEATKAPVALCIPHPACLSQAEQQPFKPLR